MVRITFPNPLGPPITLDTSAIPSFRSSSSSVFPLGSVLRRPHTRIVIIIALILVVIIYRPSPPFPPSYASEWAAEKAAAAGGASGRAGRYVKFDVPQGTGFNHQLQRQLLQHHLALLGNRSLAYEPFVEDKTVRRLDFVVLLSMI